MYNTDEMTYADQLEALRRHLKGLLSLIDSLTPYQASALLSHIADLELSFCSAVYEDWEYQHLEMLNKESNIYSICILQLDNID